MRQLRIGDPWVEAHQMRPAELLAEARVFAAQRAILRGSPRVPRAGRGWAASALVLIGHRLLGLVSRLSAPAAAHRRQGLERDRVQRDARRDPRQTLGPVTETPRLN
jgi:hypothetical protein